LNVSKSLAENKAIGGDEAALSDQEHLTGE
jgi:hypothetical protein